MKIAVVGAGAIGNLIAGYLELKNEDVFLVGRPDTVKAVRQHGLKISGVRGDFKIRIDIFEALREKPELVILTTKTQDIALSIKENFYFLKDSLILTTQNGIQADNFAGEYLPKENIISSIVMFGATYLEPGKVVHNFEGSWIIGKMLTDRPEPDEDVISLGLILDKAFSTSISPDIRGMKYLKIFANANNCIPAILGMSMQEAFSDLEISRISISIWKEGFEIISKAGIQLVSLPGFPVDNLTKLTRMPSLEAAKIFSGIMTNLSKDPLYGSILQSIKRERITEIDYINGEFVNLARKNYLSAPLNEKLVEMVHEVEKNKSFFSKEELLSEVKNIM